MSRVIGRSNTSVIAPNPPPPTPGSPAVENNSAMAIGAMLSPMPMSRHRFRPSMFRTADGPNRLPFPIQAPTRPRGRPSARVELQDRGVKISKSRTIHRNVSCVRSARLINPLTTNAFTAFPRYRFVLQEQTGTVPTMRKRSSHARPSATAGARASAWAETACNDYFP